MVNKKLIGIGILVIVVILIIISTNPMGLFSAQNIPPISCGNGICEPQRGETYLNCHIDCAFCGNGICEYNKFPSETYENCPEDCSKGNGMCEPEYGEHCGNTIDCWCGYDAVCINNKCVDIVLEEIPEPEPSVLNQELFKVGEVSITLLMLIIVLGVLFALAMFLGK